MNNAWKCFTFSFTSAVDLNINVKSTVNTKSSKFLSRPLSSQNCLKHQTEDAVLFFVFLASFCSSNSSISVSSGT